MARKVTYKDLERLQEGQAALAEGQSVLAANVAELKAEIKTELKTMMELLVQNSQSQKQLQVQELAEMQDHIQQELVHN